jgi:hypothetical protein
VRAGAALFKRIEGFLIGNPGINSDWYFNINEYAFQTYLWSHGLLPEKAGGANIQFSLCSTLISRFVSHLQASEPSTLISRFVSHLQASEPSTLATLSPCRLFPSNGNCLDANIHSWVLDHFHSCISGRHPLARFSPTSASCGARQHPLELRFTWFLAGSHHPSQAYRASYNACGWKDFFSDCSKDFTHPTPLCKAANTAA